MVKILLTFCLILFMVGTYGCRDRADNAHNEAEIKNRITKIVRVEEQRKEEMKYKIIAEFVEKSLTRIEKVSYNLTVNDIGMTKGQAIQVFGIPNTISFSYSNGVFWGTYKSTLWEYPSGLRLHFKKNTLATWQN